MKNLIARLLTQDSFVKNNTDLTSVNVSEIMNKISIQFVRYCTNEVETTDSSKTLPSSVKEDLATKVKNESKKLIQAVRIKSKG